MKTDIDTLLGQLRLCAQQYRRSREMSGLRQRCASY